MAFTVATDDRGRLGYAWYFYVAEPADTRAVLSTVCSSMMTYRGACLSGDAPQCGQRSRCRTCLTVCGGSGSARRDSTLYRPGVWPDAQRP